MDKKHKWFGPKDATTGKVVLAREGSPRWVEWHATSILHCIEKRSAGLAEIIALAGVLHDGLVAEAEREGVTAVELEAARVGADRAFATIELTEATAQRMQAAGNEQESEIAPMRFSGNA